MAHNLTTPKEVKSMTAAYPPIRLRCPNGHEFAITIEGSLLRDLQAAQVIEESGETRPLTGEEVGAALGRLNLAGRLCPSCQDAASNQGRIPFT
jgi:hypothetical protein